MTGAAARVLLVLLATVPVFDRAQAEQSDLQRCLSLPANAGAASVEYCEGIRAAAGYGMPQNMTLAFQHVLKAAQMGYADAQSMVGDGYRTGYPVAQDLPLAAQWYAKAIAQGSASAAFNLGLMYVDGRGVPKDLGKARQLLQTAANRGNAQAQQALTRLGSDGWRDDPGRALQNQAVARYNAGDHAGAAQLFLKAVKAGNVRSAYVLGYLYMKGDGVPKDPARAAALFLDAAQKGESGAAWGLGELYETGQGVPDNWIEAAKWYRKSAELGNKLGEAALGRAYEYGVGVPLDLNEAVVWYDKAAAQGDSKAAYFAQYIRNNHGMDGSTFSDEERALMAPYMTQPWYLHAPPTGRVFRNTQDRMSYFQAWARNAAAYEACRQRHFGALPGTTYTCPAPEPPR
jgi:uncharacterized protein